MRLARPADSRPPGQNRRSERSDAYKCDGWAAIVGSFSLVNMEAFLSNEHSRDGCRQHAPQDAISTLLELEISCED
jgi:hypothetical protein